MRHLTFIACFILLAYTGATQSITLNNPSFEDEPSDATTPMGWFECTESTTPDIFPGYWGVYDEASDGDTYLGLIIREDRSYEAIGQRTSATMLPDKCYKFTMDLAHSNTYAGYRAPAKLRIYIGASKCSQSQMVFESELIKHEDWKTYLIEFTPIEESNYIYFEAVDKKGIILGSKGNILLDAISSINICTKA